MLTNERVQKFRELSRTYSDTSILMHEAIARQAGLTGTDHKYLGLILQHPKVTAGEIAKMTGLTNGAVTGLIDRLEKKKLVERQFDKEDRRKVWIVPNPSNAIQLLEPLFTELQEKTTRLIHSFSETEIGTVERYFAEAIAIMNEMKEKFNCENEQQL
jgi:DNA-binding MarR family transcriptional regulator